MILVFLFESQKFCFWGVDLLKFMVLDSRIQHSIFWKNGILWVEESWFWEI
jgi:hypothetical protein